MEKTTLFDDISDWMRRYKSNSVKQATYDRLETTLALMDQYDISSIPTDELTEDDLQQYINQLVEDNYALSTIRKQFHLLTAYLSYTRAKGITTRDICACVKMPTKSLVRKAEKEVYAYSSAEQQRLRWVLESNRLPGYYAALLMLETGMRVGECLALTWDDIDWDRNSIHIHKTFVRLGNHRRQFIQNEAKSFCSNRTIPLSSYAQSLLMKMQKLQSVDWIFHNELGDPLSYEAMRYEIGKACSEANVPYYGMHVFRHTFATNCYNRGCDVKILSKLLGHSNVTITYNIYIHLFDDALEEMRKVIG